MSSSAWCSEWNAAAEFNSAVAVGGAVRYWPAIRVGQPQLGYTASPAVVVGDYIAAVYIQGCPGAVPLTHVQRVPPTEPSSGGADSKIMIVSRDAHPKPRRLKQQPNEPAPLQQQ